MKLFMIAKSNMKRNKSMTFTLTALMILSTILLYIGISVIVDIGTFLDGKNRDLNGSDLTVMTPKIYDEAVRKILYDMGGIDQLEAEDMFIKNSVDLQNITLGEKVQSVGKIFLNADQSGEISLLNIIDQGEEKLANSIILPYFLKIANGYQTGDEISITYGGVVHSFIVYGFSEDIMFATPSNIPLYKCYVFQEQFDTLYEAETEMFQAVLIKTKLKDGFDQAQYDDDFVKNTNMVLGNIPQIEVFHYELMKTGVSFFIIILMAILVVVSFIITVIALTVMRFAIVTYIEGSIKNIGSMEAMGYTAKQLMFATIIQFIIISVVGCILGYLLSFSGANFITQIVSSSIGLAWNSGININAIVISFLMLNILVIAIVSFAAVKIKKITPIIALRCGINTHNFKKNRFPLAKSLWNVNIAIGLKAFTQNAKQNITILIIVILMSFVAVFSFTVDYNFNVDNTAFIRLIGLERAHIAVSYTGEDALDVFDAIGEKEQVVKTARLTSISMPLSNKYQEVTPLFSVCNDFSLLEISTVVHGRYPIHDNEIAVTGLILKNLDAKLGDVVTIKGSESKHEFIIVGVTQHINYLGKGASLTEEGMKRINENFIPSQLFVYLDAKDQIPAVMEAIEQSYENVNVTNVEDSFETILGSFNSAVTMMTIVCIAITLCVITLILYLLIKIRLLKERTRIGLSKALGYTTRQLVIQIIISFCPVCILGAFIGTGLAMFLINPAFAAMLSISGILNSNLTISPLLTIATFVGVSLFSIIITALVSVRIKAITPYELFV